MTKEIGSEFHSMALENGDGIIFPRKGTLTFSGRTAIELVLKEFSVVKTALIPSYCCDSMIESFRKMGIDVTFYDVNYKDGLSIDFSGDADVLLWCNYFGFNLQMPEFEGRIIEDITHSLFSDKVFHAQSDYLVASVRKWEPVLCGGYCSIEVDGNTPSEAFIRSKWNSMELKRRYLLDGDSEKKAVYLSGFHESNEWIKENYSGLLIDNYSARYISSVDMEEQKSKRRRNAHILYEGLRGKVEFLFDERDMDCPLFVPIVMKKIEI